MLTSADLTWMKAAQNDALPDSGTITRPTSAADGAGGSTASTESLGPYDCRRAPANMGSEELAAYGIVATQAYIVTWAADRDVKVTDQVTIDGDTLEVKAVLDAGAWETARRTLCVEVG